MAITVEATYENGVLKPARPLPLREHESVEITIRTRTSRAVQTYGLLGWTGDAATFDRILEEAEPEDGD